MAGIAPSTNVVRLPTAAPARIVNPYRAARTYRRTQPHWPMPPLPVARAALALTAERSPALVILVALLEQLTDEQRRAVQDRVHRVHFLAADDVSRAAAAIVTRLA